MFRKMQNEYVYYEKIESGKTVHTNIKTLYSFNVMVNGLSGGYIRNWVDDFEFTWVDFGSHSEFYRYKILDTVEIEFLDGEGHFLTGDTMSLDEFIENFSAQSFFSSDGAYSLDWLELPLNLENRKLYYRFDLTANEDTEFEVPRPEQTVETRVITILYLLGEHSEDEAHKHVQKMVNDYYNTTGLRIGYQIVDRGLEIYDGDIESE